MVNKLRTLKDIDFTYPEVYDEEYEKVFDHEKKEELRIEAIKHINNLKKTAIQRNNGYFQPTIDWIKYWFNIKERDLK